MAAGGGDVVVHRGGVVGRAYGRSVRQTVGTHTPRTPHTRHSDEHTPPGVVNGADGPSLPLGTSC